VSQIDPVFFSQYIPLLCHLYIYVHSVLPRM